LLTCEQAHTRAIGMIAAARNGDDPTADRDADRKTITVKELAERFDKEHVSVRVKESTAKGYRHLLEPKLLPACGRHRVTEVTRADIAKLHHELRHTPYDANRCLEVISKMFSLAEMWGLRPKSTAPPEPRRRRSKPLAEGFSAVTEIDVRASAGPGAINDGLEESKETWLLPDPIIRHEFRARAMDLHIVTIDGDPMEPLLSSGDRILIDTSQRVPVPPGIFVIWDGLGIVAKRIEHIPHSEPPKIVIKSVNPEYQTYERDGDEVNIIGRVIWAAKRL